MINKLTSYYKTDSGPSLQNQLRVHSYFRKSLRLRLLYTSGSRAWQSAHVWEKQICLKIQQRQRNAKWFQSLLFFQLKKNLKVFSTSAGGSVKPNR